MTGPTLSLLVQFALGLSAGIAVGYIHFRSLHWNATLLSRPGSLMPAIGLQLVRFLLLIGVLFLLTRFGALALLSGAIGIVVSRQFVVRRLGAIS